MRPDKTIALCFVAALICLAWGCSSVSLPKIESPWRHARRNPILPPPAPILPTTVTLPTLDENTTGPWKIGTKSRGISCWYGAKHHGLPTANGEIFSRYAFTAAHPSIPFGTRIRVRNLDNQKETVVRVTDRCADIKGRILDLSEAAAHAVGVRECGMTQVEIEVVADSTPVPERLVADVLPSVKVRKSARKSSAASRRAISRRATSRSASHRRMRPLQALKGSRHKSAPAGKVRLGTTAAADSGRP